MYTDDECFFVGLGHSQSSQAQAARKSKNFPSNDYRPFQCCPTKLEKATKVPKMTAQRLAHKDDDEKTGFHFNTQKKEATTSKSKVISNEKAGTAAAAAKKTAVSGGSITLGGKKLAEPLEKKDTKAESRKLKAKDKGVKQGQKGLLGIGKIVNWL